MKAPLNCQSIAKILLNFGENSEIGSKIGNKIAKIGSASSYAYALFWSDPCQCIGPLAQNLSNDSQKFEPPHLPNWFFFLFCLFIIFQNSVAKKLLIISRVAT